MKKITVSDVTLKQEKLKDSTFREKLAIVSALDLSGVDCIELPALNGSKESEVTYRTIAESVKNAKVSISVGADEGAVETAYECIKGREEVILQVVVPVSTPQMEYIYHLKAPAMLERISSIVKKCVSFAPTEVVMIDATRAEDGFLAKCAQCAKDAGAFAVTLCDDAGIAFPEDMAETVIEVKKTGIDVYVCPSNALNMAVACAVSAIKAGADGIKTSTCGDYVAPAILSDLIRARGADIGVTTSLDATKIHSLTETVSKGGETVKTAKSVDGKLNPDSTLKDVIKVAKKMGYDLTDEDYGKVYEEFKRVIRKKETIGSTELDAIIASTAMQVPSTYHLVTYVVNNGNIIPATANVTLEREGEKLSGVSTGDGPIDAAFHAIEQIIGHHYELDDFQIHSVTKGREAVGSSVIRLRANGKLYSGNGVSTDIISACIRAYINALNKIVYEEN